MHPPKMEKELKHFSHEQHPLILCGVQQIKVEDKDAICYGCRKQISLEPVYTCAKCSIFMHKQCAELPRQITHTRHTEHPLKLFAKPPYRGNYSSCDVCKQDWYGFTYHCSSCEFDVDILCAFAESKLEHPSHKHPLTFLQRTASFVCDACGEKDEDQSYLCTTCLFWIHKSCALLPATMEFRDHNHSLSLGYSLPLECRSLTYDCDVCHKVVHQSDWVFYCGPCRYFIHLKCLTREPNQLQGEIDPEIIQEVTKEQLIQLPAENVVKLIEDFVERKCDQKVSSLPQVQHFSHEHSLTLSSVQDDLEVNGEIICDGCVEPIEDSCYSCPECNYFLHLACAQLPRELQLPNHPHHELYLDHFTRAFDVFKCRGCDLFSNGFFYKCKTCEDFHFDVKCASLPTTIVHESHKHPLSQFERSKIGCSSCGYIIKGMSFGCELCSFYLSQRCVLLPKTAKHRWDKHPLPLSFPPFDDHPDEFYCPICELELHPRRWMYHCCECDQSFHPECLPTLGLYCNLKFGHTLQVGNHPHALTFIRESKFNTKCTSCNLSFDCFASFTCASCQFYLCRSCVIKSS